MKDKRIVRVKNPKLRKIRNEMRELLLQARDADLNKITHEMELMEFDKDDNRITIDELAPSQLERFRRLQQMKYENREIGRKSICLCYNCGKSDQDMYYNHPYRAWFCVGCVDFLKTAHTKVEAKKVRGEYTCDPDGEFGQSFF